MNELELINEWKSIQYAISEQEDKEVLLQREREILEAFYTQYKKLIYKICIQFNKFEFKELTSVGIISLKYVIEKFDDTKGMKFSSYLAWVLKRDLAKEITSKGVTIPFRMRELIYLYKKVNPENIDEWLKVQLSKESYKTFHYENTKTNILKYANMKYVTESKSAHFETQYLKQDSFEDEVVDKVSTPINILNDIKNIVGDTYAEIFRLSVVDGLKLHEIADRMQCSKNNIHIKLKKTLQKLRTNEKFMEKYKEFC